MALFINDNGTWREAVPSAKLGGAIRTVQKGFVNVSGTWREFYSSELVVVVPTTSAAQNIANIFNSHTPGSWGDGSRKRLVVSSSVGPLVVNSMYGGSLTIEVTSSGVVSGVGGAANGGAGGHGLAVTAATGIQLVNNGTIRGGGGGGGRGGVGGVGGGGVISNVTTVREPPSGDYYESPNGTLSKGVTQYTINAFPVLIPVDHWLWDALVSDNATDVTTSGGWMTALTHGGYRYYRGSKKPFDSHYGIYRTYTGTVNTNTNGGNGGGGGNGGRGDGANGSYTSGSPGGAGANGGTNAGRGGTGGAGGRGGSWGQAGSAGARGANGANGNRTNGAAGANGSAGGAAGRSISGYNRVVYSGGGALVGPTANT